MNIIERVLPDTYRMTVVARTLEQDLRAALLWAGDEAAADGRSSGYIYRLEGIRPKRPEIVVPRARRLRSSAVAIRQPKDREHLMLRRFNGWKGLGVEATLLVIASLVEEEALEVACEDARRRRLTSIPALTSYLDRFGVRGRNGVAPLRALLRQLDPVHPSRSTLEVVTRRLLVASGITDFVREFPLEWSGRTYYFDFNVRGVILETNGRRWHDDAADYEHDNEKWSVPARHGYRIVFATWDKVTKRPRALIEELKSAITPGSAGATRRLSPAAARP